MSEHSLREHVHAPHGGRRRASSSGGLADLGSTTKSRSWLALAIVVLLMLAAVIWGVFGSITVQTTVSATTAGGGLVYKITAPIDGTVQALSEVGVVRARGTTIAVIAPRGNGQPQPLRTTHDTLVTSWNVVLGSPVKAGDVIATGVVYGLSPNEAGINTDKLIAAVAYLPLSQVELLQSAVGIQVVPVGVDGTMEPVPVVVLSASSFPVSARRIALTTNNPIFASRLAKENDGETYEVFLGFANAEDAAGMADATQPGQRPSIATGSPAQVIVTEVNTSPLLFLFGGGV